MKTALLVKYYQHQISAIAYYSDTLKMYLKDVKCVIAVSKIRKNIYRSDVQVPCEL